MANIFDTLSLDETPKSNIFDTISLEQANKPLGIFDELTLSTSLANLSPTTALQTSFTEFTQLKDKYPNLTPADINEFMVRKKMGEEVKWTESLGDVPIHSYAPLVSTGKILKVKEAVDRLTNEEYDIRGRGKSRISQYAWAPTQYYTREQDTKAVEGYMRELELGLAKEELLGLTTGAKISAGAARTLPYILDFLVTKGTTAGVKSAVLKSVERMAGKAAGKSLLARGAATTVAAGARTPLQPGTYDELLKKLLPYTQIDSEGNLDVLQKGYAAEDALLETWAERTVGNLAEVSGGTIMKGVNKILGKTLGKIPVGKAVMKAVNKLHTRIFPKASQREVAKKTFNAVGIQGLPEEWAEERFEGVMRQVLELPGGGLLPASAEEAITELGILGIFGTARIATMMPFAFQPEAGSPEAAIKELKNVKKLLANSPEIRKEKKPEIQADLDKRIQQLEELQEATYREQELTQHLARIKEERSKTIPTARPHITAELQQRIDDLEDKRTTIRGVITLTDEQKENEYRALDQEIFGLQRQIQREQETIEQGLVAPVNSVSRTDAEHIKRIEQELTIVRERRLEQQRIAQEEYTAIITERARDATDITEGGPRVGSETIISESQMLPTIENREIESAVVNEGQMLATPIETYRPGPTTTVPPALKEGELSFKEPTLTGAALTPQSYYITILGAKYLTESAEVGKQEQLLEYRKISKDIDIMIALLNKENNISRKERRQYYKKGTPTSAMRKMAEALNTYENAPISFSENETQIFRYFRNLSRGLIERENAVRDNLGIQRIPYRTAYFRHVAEKTAQEIIEGTQELPDELRYWMTKQVTSKIYNPTEFTRRLGSELEKLYSRDLGAVSKSMAWFSLKEIHLSKPLKYFNDELDKVKDIIPEKTRNHIEEFIRICIKGQETDIDGLVNNMITKTGLGRTINVLLKPFGKHLSERPLTNLGRKIGRLNITFALWGRPKLVIRNLFQRLQNLALYGIKANLRSILPATKQIKNIMASSTFWRGYTGIEELNPSSLRKLERVGMMPFQWSARANAGSAMKAAYWDTLELITDKKYKDLGWADSRRTYTEPKGFLYESELQALKYEMEFGAGCTQFQYIPMAMPGVFKHKTAVPLTRLQSWWMNYFFKFTRESLLRMFTGKTAYGKKLPWSRRLGYARYLLMGCPILQLAGYGASTLAGVLPTTLAPAGILTWALYKWITADDDKERKRAENQIKYNLPSLVPGGLLAKDVNKIWEGEADPDILFLYDTHDDEGAWWSTD